MTDGDPPDLTDGARATAATVAGVPPRVVAALSRCRPPVCAYVYDTAALRERATGLRAALPGVELLYAVKANGHPAVVRTLAGCLDGLEVASGGELALARGAVDPGRRQLVAFAGPAKTDAELRSAIDAGALVHVESGHELRRLAQIAGGARVGVALRVNRAGVALSGSHRMSGVATPFGVDETELGAVVALARALPQIDLLGFHLHAVSNNLDAAAHARFVGDALRWAVAAAGRHDVRLRYVNLGGGLGVDPTGAEVFALADLSRGVAAALSGLPPDVRVVLEPGRFLAAEAGWYATEVLDLKRTHGRWFAVLRGGTHHFRLPAAWGYSHPFTVLPVERWEYPFDRPEVRGVPIDAVGELCTPRDVLTRGQVVERLRVGDVLVFARAGAYAWDISHHEFLRHPHPATVVI